jgi:hypothetical protein
MVDDVRIDLFISRCDKVLKQLDAPKLRQMKWAAVGVADGLSGVVHQPPCAGRLVKEWLGRLINSAVRLDVEDEPPVAWANVERLPMRTVDAVPEATRLVRRLKCWAGKLKTKPAEEQATEAPKPNEPPPPRLTVNLPGMTVTLDDNTYNTDSKQALRWLQILADHPGEWLSSTECATLSNDALMGDYRPHRLMHKLPEPVRTLIETNRRKGYRITLGPTKAV